MNFISEHSLSFHRDRPLEQRLFTQSSLEGAV